MYEQDTPDHYYLGQNFSALQAEHGHTLVQEAVSICESIINLDLVSGAKVILHLSQVVRNETIKRLVEEGKIK